MKICRFRVKDDASAKPRIGVVSEHGFHDVTAITDKLPQQSWPYPQGDHLIANLPDLIDDMAALAKQTDPVQRNDIHLLPPVANPGKFVCGAGNWKHHGAPLGMMGFMFKASSALSGPDDNVQIRWPDRVTLHEPELAIIIGKTCTNIDVGQALEYVAGYSCALDMTMQQDREDFAFCKSFDSFGMIGPWFVTADEIADPSALDYHFHVNGALRGDRSFADLTGSPAELVAFASTAMTLYPGDIILSGAADVAPVAIGDHLALDITGIGRLETHVVLSRHARSARPHD